MKVSIKVKENPTGFLPAEVHLPSSSHVPTVIRIDPFFVEDYNIGYMARVHGKIPSPLAMEKPHADKEKTMDCEGDNHTRVRSVTADTKGKNPLKPYQNPQSPQKPYLEAALVDPIQIPISEPISLPQSASTKKAHKTHP